MRIGGLQKCSLVDFPGKVAAVIFTQGCNFRCGYCHNRQLVIPDDFCETIPVAQVFDFLRGRGDYLQGVVVTGGEPTIHHDLIPFLQQIKTLGYAIKLDTNGSFPKRLEEIIQTGLVDYIAMDVKAPLDQYGRTVGVVINSEAIRESIELIKASSIAHEFRTTVCQSLCSRDDVKVITDLVKDSDQYTLQLARINSSVIDQSLVSQEALPQTAFKHWQQTFEFKRSHYSN